MALETPRKPTILDSYTPGDVIYPDKKFAVTGDALTYTDVFVGRLKEPDFDWSDPYVGLDRNDIEFLTGSLMDYRIFSWVCAREKGQNSRQLDWGSFVVLATRDEILGLMAQWRPGNELPGPGDENHKPKQSRLRSLETVSALPAGEACVLVSEEF